MTDHETGYLPKTEPGFYYGYIVVVAAFLDDGRHVRDEVIFRRLSLNL